MIEKNMAKKSSGKKKKKADKKEAQLVLRIDRETRDRFVEACKDIDTSAARELRRHIKRFIKRYDAGEFDD